MSDLENEENVDPTKVISIVMSMKEIAVALSSVHHRLDEINSVDRPEALRIKKSVLDFFERSLDRFTKVCCEEKINVKQ